MSESDLEVARAKGFSECLLALRRALTTTPFGWAVALWFCWDSVPMHALLSWLGVAAIAWAGGLALLQSMVTGGATLRSHRRHLYAICALDGFGWGLLTWFLIGHGAGLDAMLMALLCGVTSINAQVYGTFVSAYYWMIGTLWITACLGLFHSADSRTAINYASGFTVFVTLTAYYSRTIGQRLVEGIRLQYANAKLADQLREALQKVELDAATDPLTGHWNRRALDDILKRQAESSAASRKPFSILMLDIDFFKKINDEFGHMIGDDVLRAFAQTLREFLRAGDFCARFGGEEFVAVLPDTTTRAALEIAERIRNGVAQRALLLTPHIQVTVSIGAATTTHGQDIGELLARADAAVYLAKNGGRNRVCSAADLTLLAQAIPAEAVYD